jgi:hypothetical protein
MRLAGSADALTLRVTGYQFPDAQDLRKRYSWHTVEGQAACPRGSWRFRFPALTCDESPRISKWLREVAGDAARSPVRGQPGILEFTEPNLYFSVAGRQPGEARPAGRAGPGVPASMASAASSGRSLLPGHAPHGRTVAVSRRGVG